MQKYSLWKFRHEAIWKFIFFRKLSIEANGIKRINNDLKYIPPTIKYFMVRPAYLSKYTKLISRSQFPSAADHFVQTRAFTVLRPWFRLFIGRYVRKFLLSAVFACRAIWIRARSEHSPAAIASIIALINQSSRCMTRRSLGRFKDLCRGRPDYGSLIWKTRNKRQSVKTIMPVIYGERQFAIH